MPLWPVLFEPFIPLLSRGWKNYCPLRCRYFLDWSGSIERKRLSKLLVSGFETLGDFGPPSSPALRSQGTWTGGLCICSGIGQILARTEPALNPGRGNMLWMHRSLVPNTERSCSVTRDSAAFSCCGQGQFCLRLVLDGDFETAIGYRSQREAGRLILYGAARTWAGTGKD
jgi:hypothetical protein